MVFIKKNTSFIEDCKNKWYVQYARVCYVIKHQIFFHESVSISSWKNPQWNGQGSQILCPDKYASPNKKKYLTGKGNI